MTNCKTAKKGALLITGGAGFIGSNFVMYMVDKYPDYHIVNLDKLTYAGSTANLQTIENRPNYHFIKGDVADEETVTRIFSDYDINGVIHLAAESHVDRSIADAKQFVETNLLGTTVLLQTAKKDWEEKGVLQKRRFHQVSTDEIYGSLGENGKFSEDTPYAPRNPYSASKAGANFLVSSFGHTYGMNVVISSCSNNYGPRQHREKLIPTIISKALALEPIPIYGDGKNIRDWIYVMDHVQALDMIFHKGKRLETYNVGGNNERTNMEIAKTVCMMLDELQPALLRNAGLDSFQDLITYTADRLGHDRRYAVDDSKIRSKLGWHPQTQFQQGIRQTVEWYLAQWGQSAVTETKTTSVKKGDRNALNVSIPDGDGL
ncbi:dTDP-glucose 4,6-dehydratase [Virgibacillus sp. 179-BFC.A HS]|uniref:dTDP-glucose 4,6-dehydratase n=1 Tax=Tigheibacillus jepli TaxID=3035914 RepID=A0ABU5CDK3_9BACI|nr:dTDP-glucose 4,6-dehydratase [Virgibacillus sp. 179-BFC.A HS]MDY0404356.1 dTDP-glucose 4,6-dehydratase [Virgibacillus sp. 179-BFC.A HS]